ncbi:MAG: hypothetical protein ABW175_02215, partial [Bradyrhizobium sp.]
RQFEIVGAPGPKATIALSAKLVDGAGHLKAARVFKQTTPVQALSPTDAVSAFNESFEALAGQLVLWVAQSG